MIKTILVPTDGSELAVKAVTLAADIAGKYEARLVLLNVMQRGPLPEALRHMAEVEHLTEAPVQAVAGMAQAPIPTPIASPNAESARRVYEAIAEQVLNAGERLAKEQGAKNLEKISEEGDPAKRILEQAKKSHANLIVMGSRGLSDVKGLLMGSVSHKVSNLADCSCITVK